MHNNLNFPVAGEPAKSLEIIQRANAVTFKSYWSQAGNFVIVKMRFTYLAKSFRNGTSVLASTIKDRAWDMDHSLTREISASMPEPKTHAMQKAPVSLKSLRNVPQRHKPQACIKMQEYKPSYWDVTTNLWCCNKAQARVEREEKRVGWRFNGGALKTSHDFAFKFLL